jgi:regulator of sirC expression with transglutaminase-like and TPR domain
LAQESTDIREKVLKADVSVDTEEVIKIKNRGHIYRRLKAAHFSRHQGVGKVHFGTP